MSKSKPFLTKVITIREYQYPNKDKPSYKAKITESGPLENVTKFEAVDFEDLLIGLGEELEGD